MRDQHSQEQFVVHNELLILVQGEDTFFQQSRFVGLHQWKAVVHHNSLEHWQWQNSVAAEDFVRLIQLKGDGRGKTIFPFHDFVAELLQEVTRGALVLDKACKVIAANAGAVLGVNGCEQSAELAFRGRRLFLDNFVGEVNVGHKDILELIESDEAWELLAIPVNVCLWLNFGLFLLASSGPANVKVGSKRFSGFLHEVGDGEVEVLLAILLLGGELGLFLPIVILVFMLGTLRANNLLLLGVLALVLAVLHVLWISASRIDGAVDGN